MSTAWRQPRALRVCFAKATVAKKIFQEGKAKFSSVGYEELSGMGIGVGLYFKILKVLLKAFIGGSVLMLPSLIFNICGDALPDTDIDALSLSLTTAGNFGKY